MKKFLTLTLAGLVVSCSALAAEPTNCKPWADYMAKTMVPDLMGVAPSGVGGFGMVTAPNSMPSPMPSSTPFSGGTYGAGVYGGGTLSNGAIYGYGYGFMSLPIPTMTEGVRASLKGDRAKILQKYKEYFLVQEEMMAEWMEFSERQAEAMRNGSHAVFPNQERNQALARKMASAEEAFKKGMFEFGQKNDCMLELSASVQQRAYANTTTVYAMLNEQLDAATQKFRQLKSDCSVNKLKAADDVNKVIKDLTKSADAAHACPSCAVVQPAQ